MFKNFVIALLLISTAVFGWLAIRNATPTDCDELIRTESGSLICQTNLGKVTEDEARDAMEKIREEAWKW